MPILHLPHAFDRGALDEDYARVLQFLKSIEKVREREWTNGNGEFFHIVAGQWLELASLQYIFNRETVEIVETAKRGLSEFIVGLELADPVEPPDTLKFFSAAVAVNDATSVQALSTAPNETLGFLDDPDDPFPLLVTAAFVFAADEDREAGLNLDMLHGILFESPLDKTYAPMKREMVSLYHLMSAIREGDAGKFDKHLLERCQARVDIFNSDDAEDKPSVIDWSALALVCTARDRGLPVSIQHPYVPLSLVDVSGRWRTH
jgi:hypothetical protein